MVAVPVDTPVTTLVAPTTVACASLLVHVPPAGVEFNVIVAPIHTFREVTAVTVGLPLTVTATESRQPVTSL